MSLGSARGALPGVVLTLTISAVSFLSSLLHPLFDPLVVSIIFGMLVSNLVGERRMFAAGEEISLAVFLPVGISLYGAQISFAGTDLRLLPAVLAGGGFIFVVTYLLSRGFGLGRTLSMLMGTGLSVCGASAIALVSPLLGARKEDTSLSIISVMVVGLAGMLLYRLLPGVVGLSQWKYAFLTGMTLPMLGQVKVAAAILGEESLRWATSVKLIRVSGMAFLAALAVILASREGRKLRVPWFMAAFFGLAAAVNVSELFASFRGALEPVGRFSLTVALSAIGLSLDFESITEGGSTPLYVACLSWGICVLAIYLVLSVVV